MARSKMYPDDLRDRLVEAARQRLRFGPTSEVSLRELAAECDTSTNAVYSIFGCKDALVDAVIASARADFVGHLGAIATGDSSIDAFAASGLAYRRWALENPSLYRMMFGSDPGHQPAPGLIRSAVEPMRTIVRGLIARGLVVDDDPEAICLSIWASTHGFVLLEMTLWPGGAPEADAGFRLHLTRCVAGYLTDEARRQGPPPALS